MDSFEYIMRNGVSNWWARDSEDEFIEPIRSVRCAEKQQYAFQDVNSFYDTALKTGERFMKSDWVVLYSLTTSREHIGNKFIMQDSYSLEHASAVVLLPGDYIIINTSDYACDIPDGITSGNDYGRMSSRLTHKHDDRSYGYGRVCTIKGYSLARRSDRVFCQPHVIGSVMAKQVMPDYLLGNRFAIADYMLQIQVWHKQVFGESLRIANTYLRDVDNVKELIRSGRHSLGVFTEPKQESGDGNQGNMAQAR